MLQVPLSEFKRRLEDMLTDLQMLVTALKELRDALPEHSEKRTTVLTLLGRLNDANQKALRGTIDNTALQIEYNAIRADLSDLIQGLEESDFNEAASKPAPGKPSGPKQGSVLYRIPDTMPLGEETACLVRIAIDDAAIVEEIVIDDQVVLKDLSRVSDLMQVELTDPAREPVFRIRSTSTAQQLITEEGFSQWNFYVEPLQVGTFPLEVKVSVLELAFNQVHRKELVFREAVQIVTGGGMKAPEAEDAGHAKDVEENYFKQAGAAFAFAGAAPEFSKSIVTPESRPPYQPPSEPSLPDAHVPTGSNSGMRVAALFMAFLLLGTTATWALTPPATRDWWIASIVKDDEAAYTEYLEKYPESNYREKAMFYRAERSEKLAYLLDYQKEYGEVGKYREKIASRLTEYETRALNEIRQDPRREKIEQFAQNFTDTKRLSELKDIAEKQVDRRAELLQAVEDAYVNSTIAKPTEQKIKAYLRDFPEHTKLDQITTAAEQIPEVKNKVQGELEDAYLKKLEKNLTPDAADEFLEKFPEAVRKEKFNALIDKQPAVKKQVDKMRKMTEQAKSLLQWEKQKGDQIRSGLEMARVEGGVFLMGSPVTEPGRSDDECQHSVTVGSFAIGKYEVTQADWVKIMGHNPSNFHTDPATLCADCPVEQVSWNSILLFLQKLNAANPGRKFRLPTEAEWEYAARGGNRSKGYLYSGSNTLNEVAWSIANSGGETHPVGRLAPNELGLYDMSGNVWEWCSDQYSPYPDCQGTARVARVVRGGSFVRNVRSFRPAFRNAEPPTQRSTGLGFRLAESL